MPPMAQDTLTGLGILIVEDELLLRRTLTAQLERLGAGVTAAGAVSVARALIPGLSLDFALVDVNLPDGAGTDLLREKVFYYYAQASGQNIFYVSGAPDQQFTLDYSTNLKTWTTGPLLDLIYGSGTLTFLTSLGANPPPAQFYRVTLVP